MQFFPSLIVARILQFSSSSALGSDAILNKGFYLSLLLFLVLCLKTIVENQYFDMVINLGANIRGTLSSAIYRKALKLGPSSRKNNSVIMRILSHSDDTTFGLSCFFFVIDGRDRKLHAD